VVCGLHGYSTRPLHDLRDSLGLRDAVEFPAGSRARIFTTSTRAWAFVYPSRFEGFGLRFWRRWPPASPPPAPKIEPLSSIAAGAALEFDPLDTTAIAEAILRITADEPLRTRLVEAGPRAAAQSPAGDGEGTLAALLAVGG